MNPRSLSQDGPSSPRGKLEDELATLVRVRNRLAQSPNDRLPRVLTNLLPKIMRRIDENTSAMYSHSYARRSPSTAPSGVLAAGVTDNDRGRQDHDNQADLAQPAARPAAHATSRLPNHDFGGSEEIGNLHSRIREESFGILNHAMERIRGDATMICCNWTRSLLGIVESSRGVSLTWILSFLQLGISRLYEESMPESTFPVLIRLVDRLHGDLENDTQFRAATHWKMASSILLATISIMCGSRPAFDFDKTTTGNDFGWHLQPFASWPSLISAEAVEAATRDGRGLFHLLLDVLLYWPNSWDRHRSLHAASGMSDLGEQRMTTCVPRDYLAANPSHLRQLQLACLRCAIWPPNQCLLQGRNHDRALLLSILLAATDSVRGSLAMSFVSQSESPIPLSLRPDATQIPTRKMPTTRLLCSMPLLSSLLILLVGHRGENKALDEHIQQGNAPIWESVLGPLPGEDERNSLQRAPLPSGVATRVMKFLSERIMLQPWAARNADGSPSNIDDAAIRLVLGLIKIIAGQNKKSAYFAVQFMDVLVRHFVREPPNNEVVASNTRPTRRNMTHHKDAKKRPRQKSTIQKEQTPSTSPDSQPHTDEASVPAASDGDCGGDRIIGNNDTTSSITSLVSRATIDACRHVLLVVIDAGESSIERQVQRNRNRQHPLGVPLPFDRRRDVDRLLHDRRLSQKKWHLRSDDSVRARKCAHRLLQTFAPACLGDKQRIFEMPMLLLKCAMFEEDFMQPTVAHTLEVLLPLYQKEFGIVPTGARTATTTHQRQRQHKIVPLLPALLGAISSLSRDAKIVAAHWITDLVDGMDPEAACYLASYLHDEPDFVVQRIIRKLGPSIAEVQKRLKQRTLCMRKAEFFNTMVESDAMMLKMELQSLCDDVARTYRIPLDAAKLLLHDNEYSVRELKGAYAVGDASAALAACGVELDDANIQLEAQEAAPDTPVCGICYDDITDNTHSTPRVGISNCDHVFCTSCTAEYIASLAHDGHSKLLQATCPHHNCPRRMTPTEMATHNPKMKLAWDRSFFELFLQRSSMHRQCPGPDCTMVATCATPTASSKSSSRGTATGVTCTQCKTSFCFDCGNEPHQPAACADFVEWNRLFKSSDLWIKKHAKPCPGCQVPIEKSQGCNHMVCENCGTQFCWLCLSKLRRHSEDHVCHRYDPLQDMGGKADSEASDKRWALFASDRYDSHNQAEAFVSEQILDLQGHADHMEVEMGQLSSLPNADAKDDHDMNADDDEEEEEDGHGSAARSTALSAMLVLVDARRFLKHSYVATYARRHDPSTLTILESHQGALEMLTERLNQLTDTNLQSKFIVRGEQGIRNHYRAMDFYRMSILNYMQRVVTVMNEMHHHHHHHHHEDGSGNQ